MEISGRNLTVIHDDSRGGENAPPKFSIVAVHGLGGGQDSTWTWTPGLIDPNQPETMWLKELLPLYVSHSRVMTFGYSMKSQNGISVDDIKAVAMALLTQLREKHSGSIIFLGHGLGGLIIKEALSIAIRSAECTTIAANTSLLVFFDTPHRAPHPDAWESLASWLMFVSSESFAYDWLCPALQRTAKMLEEVNARFGAFDRIYPTANVYYKESSPFLSHTWTWQTLDEYSATMGVPEQLPIIREEKHQDLCKFSSPDKNFWQIVEMINNLSGRDSRYIECIRMLSALNKGHNLQIPRASATDHKSILEQAKRHVSYKTWTDTPGGTLHLYGHDSYALFILPCLLAGESKTDRAISFFFDSNDNRRSGALQMLASLSYQLLCLKPLLFDHVSRLYDFISQENDWRAEKLFLFFRSLLSCPSHGQTLCLISRVDECTLGRELISQQFFDWVLSLSDRRDSKTKFIITSDEAFTASRHSTSINLKTDINELWDQNFASYLEMQMCDTVAKRPGLSAVWNDIKTSIVLKQQRGLLNGVSTDATIRLMLVLLTALSDSITRSQAKHTLESLPRNEIDIYHELFSQIPSPSRKWARNCLSWIVRAFRPLRLEELAVALVIERTEFPASEIEERTPLDLAWELNRVLGYLVRIENGEVRLAESSLRDFVTKQLHGCDETCLLCCDSHALIAEKCLMYISVLRRESPLQPPLSAKGRYGLLAYAVQHWPLHYHEAEKEAGGEFHSDFDSSLQDGDLMRTWSDLRRHYDPEVDETRSGDPISAAVAIGSLGLFKQLWNVPGSKPQLTVPLELAIQKGDEALVDIIDGLGATTPWALHIAASYGHDKLVAKLKTEENLISENAKGFTALQCACEGGSLATVEKLLKAGSEASVTNRHGLTALHVASRFGQVSIISRLLQKDIDYKAKDAPGSTPLHEACRWQQPESVRSLLGAKGPIDIGVVDENSATVLHHVAEFGRGDILDMLLERYPYLSMEDGDFAEVRALLARRDDQGSVPLHLAARGGHEQVVEKLLALDDPENPGTLMQNDDGWLPLHLAAENGHLQVVRRLLQGSTVRKQIEPRDTGRLPISLAVRREHVGVVRILCPVHRVESVSLDVFDSEGASPLHVAAKNGNIEIARLLLDNGATPDIVDSRGATPLLLACQGGFVKIVEMLLQKDANATLKNRDDISPVMAAAVNGYDRLVEMLLGRLDDKDLAVTDSRGRSLLHLASHRGHLAVVEVLLKTKAQVNSTDSPFRTPLHMASAGGHLSVVQKLLEYGVEPSSTDAMGVTPLQDASTDEVAQALWQALRKPSREDLMAETLGSSVRKGHIGLVKILLESGADPNTKSQDDGHRPLIHLAAQDGHLDLVKHLAALPTVLTDASDDGGRTPLSYAAEYGHLQVVKFLAEQQRANVNSTDNSHRSPLSYAASCGELQVVEYLLQNEAVEPDSKDKDDRSPLWYASRYGRDDTVRRLLQCEVNPHRRESQKGWTPLHAAAYDGQAGVVKLLLGAGAASDKDIGDNENRTPTYLAAYWGYTTAVSELIIGNAASNVPTVAGWRPLHAAYDNPDILKKLLDETDAEIQCQTNDGETVLHLAVGAGLRASAEFLLERNANPLSEDLEGVTPLQLTASDESGNLVGLLLPHAKRVADQENIALRGLKDKVGRTPFTEALAHTNIKAAKEFIRAEIGDINQVNQEGKTPLELAMLGQGNEADSDEIIGLLLDYIDRIDKTTIRDLVHRQNLLIWVIEKRAKLKTKILKILEGGGEPPTERQSGILFKHATDQDDVSLAEYLVRTQPDPATKDDHDWTLQQLIAAYRPVPEISSPLSFGNIKTPQVWDEKHKASELVFGGDDKRCLRYSNWSRTWYTWAATARADHPIDPSKKSYFEITVIDGGEDEIVGIGFGHKVFDPTDMPGWARTTWGYHGDDGGLFHGGSAKTSDQRKFKTRDTVGCCIDPVNGKAYFTRNGKPVDECFGGIGGRIFPMVGLRSRNAQIKANFGWDESGKPTAFQFSGDLETAFLEAKEVLINSDP